MSNHQRLIDEIHSTAWLNLTDEDLKKQSLIGPLYLPLFSKEQEYPTSLINTIRNPRYLPFLCREFFGMEIHPFQGVILREMFLRPFPMLIGTRGLGKTTLLALYAMLRAFLYPGTKVVAVGAGFRQSRFIFEYMSEIWRKSPILQDICLAYNDRAGPHAELDRCTFRIGESVVTLVPIGNGEKIRGLRANVVLSDEFATLNKDVFETVIRGFGAVSSNPIENIKKMAARQKLAEMGFELEDENDKYNQIVISGTAFYSFNHFAEYWQRYKKIIYSNQDPRALTEIFPEGKPEHFDPNDFSIIRIPYDLLPPGFLDQKSIANAKATVHTGNFQMEYGTVFCGDSQGFFKRSTIEGCTVNDRYPIIGKDGPISFNPTIRGTPGMKYVYGVDPASERDNFVITVLEVHPDHRRVVYCWSMSRAKFKELRAKNITTEEDFYGFVARKIRMLMETFPCVGIAMDSQGGGVGVEEALQRQSDLKQNEYPILDVEKEDDGRIGKRILHLISFADASWVTRANHGLRQDMETKSLIFPAFDSILLGESIEDDKQASRTYDSMEDCMLEIEDMKDELTTIVYTQTPSGRDHFDVPDIKVPGMKKGRAKKDRYSALLMANTLAKDLDQVVSDVTFTGAMGGFADGDRRGDSSGPMFSGPSWYTEQMKKIQY